MPARLQGPHCYAARREQRPCGISQQFCYRQHGAYLCGLWHRDRTTLILRQCGVSKSGRHLISQRPVTPGIEPAWANSPASNTNRGAPPPASSGMGTRRLIDNAPTPLQSVAPPSSYAPQDYASTKSGCAATLPQPTCRGHAPLRGRQHQRYGTAYPAPVETQGWTFAGCIPLGSSGSLRQYALGGARARRFVHGSSARSTPSISAQGRSWLAEPALRSLHQFNDTMRAGTTGASSWVSQVGGDHLRVVMISLGVMGAMSEGNYDSSGSGTADTSSFSSSVSNP